MLYGNTYICYLLSAHSVMEHSSENRMSIQNISIIFGPTLMWPEECEAPNLAVSMVQRGQLIEYLLHEYRHIFRWLGSATFLKYIHSVLPSAFVSTVRPDYIQGLPRAAPRIWRWGGHCIEQRLGEHWKHYNFQKDGGCMAASAPMVAPPLLSATIKGVLVVRLVLSQ